MPNDHYFILVIFLLHFFYKKLNMIITKPQKEHLKFEIQHQMFEVQILISELTMDKEHWDDVHSEQLKAVKQITACVAIKQSMTI